MPIVLLRMTFLGGQVHGQETERREPMQTQKTMFSSSKRPLKYPVGVVLTLLPSEGSGPGMLRFGVQSKATPRPVAGAPNLTAGNLAL